MFEFPYIIEILTPKRTSPDPPARAMNTFAVKYHRIFDAGCGVSVPDNPMGQPRYSFLEAVDFNNLPVASERMVMNLNTFHTKEELDAMLQKASSVGIRYLLVVRGDGGPLLSKLDPASVGGKKSVVTSTDLLRYINTEYAGKFVTGAAFNQYSPLKFEMGRLEGKIEAGAAFIVTQPVIGKDPSIKKLAQFNLPVVVEAWMSPNVELLFKSVRREKQDRDEDYDPHRNLERLHDAFPTNCVYLSMLSFKQPWHEILPNLKP